MNRQPFEKPPRWWAPNLSPAWIRLWRGVRRREQRRAQRLVGIDVVGAEHLREAIGRRLGLPHFRTRADRP